MTHKNLLLINGAEIGANMFDPSLKEVIIRYIFL